MSYWIVANSASFQSAGDDRNTLVFGSGKDKPNNIFRQKGAAMEEAERLARSAPQSPIFIFEVVDVIETKSPQFVHKRFNSSGEMIPV